MKKSEEGELVGSGPFRIDKDAARRKLGADQLKIWKHRISVISNEFIEIVCMLGVVAVVTPGAAYGYIYGDCRYLDTFQALFLMSAYSIAGIFLMALTLSIAVTTCLASYCIFDYFEARFRRVRTQWYPAGLSERIGKD